MEADVMAKAVEFAETLRTTKHGHAFEAVYDIRRALEEIDRWRRHFRGV